ncbi:MAG TPA: dienelactone hydrolase family protein [Roseomonas sp.]|jgi:dienelactone hydrolase
MHLLRLLAVLLALAGGTAAAQPLAVMGEGHVAIPGADGATLRALLLPPEGGEPGVPIVVLHGCGGLGRADRPIRLPTRERDWATRLTALGHPVLFVDSFGTRGRRETCEGGSRGVEPETVRRDDALAAAVWAAGQPWALPGGVVLFGSSDGATAALAAAVPPLPEGAIRGIIVFYPACSRLLADAPDWQSAVPLLMLLGEADDWTAARTCQRLAARAPANMDVVTYPGAHHGFDAANAPLRERMGLANTARGGGIATTGTNAAARADALRRVPEFIAGLRPVGG